MYSKNGRATRERTGEAPAHSWSLSIRLTLLYTLSAALILAVITSVVYWDVSDKLNRRGDNFVFDEIAMLQAMLREPDSEAKLQAEIDREQANLKFVKHYVRILDDAGRILMENPRMEQIIPVAAFPAPLADYTRQKRVTWRTDNDHLYVLKSVHTEIAGFGGKATVLQLAMDISSREVFLVQFRAKLVMILLLGIGLSAVAGVVVARRGLLPLSRMTRTVKDITVHRLNERIAPERWPEDLSAFALAFDSMLDRLEDSFEGLYHYTGNLAHELRTPINNLMVEADIALSRTRTPEEYQKVIGSNMEEYVRLSHIVDSLLFLARADNAQSALSLAQIDVAREIGGVAEFYSAVACDEEVRLTCCGAASLWGDPVLFRRAVSNLLSNALKYTQSGGEIVISARQGEEHGVEVEVRDTGCGIEPEDLPRIFDRFYRVASTRQKDPHGSGLGLSIVRAIMDLHGGRVEITSHPGQGTAVLLKFPHADSPAA
jgi:two-component system heavy metal sensor histidine kinase CusS